jgi:hypothetical protein
MNTITTAGVDPKSFKTFAEFCPCSATSRSRRTSRRASSGRCTAFCRDWAMYRDIWRGKIAL